MSYRIENVNNEYAIVEKATELTVASYSSFKEARSVCRGLNLGAGFNGLTPTFFCESFDQTKRKGD